MIVKICPTCGEHFIGATDYCSDKCRKEYMGLRKKAQAIKARVPRKPKIQSDLASVNEEARKVGMSYGQYVAKAKCDKEREQRLTKKGGEKNGQTG